MMQSNLVFKYSRKLVRIRYTNKATVSIGKHLNLDENGSSFVLGAFFLAFTLIVAGLAIDGSNAYLQRRKMQTAADAAALAGIHRLALGDNTAAVQSEIQAVATQNGADTFDWSYIHQPTSIKVTASSTFETFLAGIIDVNWLSTSAKSAAEYVPISRASHLLPMTIECSEVAGFIPGQTYSFWRNSTSLAGNFGWLDWTGGAASSLELAQHIANVSSSGERKVGEWVEASTGVEGSSAVRAALNGWLGESVTIPLHNAVQGTGNNLQYHICGFVRFTLTNYDFGGSNKRVEGRFEYFTLRGGAGGGTADDYGIYDIKLIR